MGRIFGSTLEAATDYLSRGWSVIPLYPRSKRPSVGWEEYQRRLPTQEELSKWFKQDANIGIVTGKVSGLVVVDLDGPSGVAEVSSLGVTSPTTVVTGRGVGRHLYFKHPGGNIPNSAGIRPGVDIRGDGGYVVAPPSMHESGKRYVWASDGSGELPLFSMPPALTRANLPSGVSPKSPGWVGEALANLQEGNRNDTFAKVVGKLHRERWAAEDILALLSPHAEGTGFPLSELSNVVASITRKPQPTTDSNSTLETPSLVDFLDENTKVDWLVPGFIATNTLGFVGGLPASRKTWLCMDLAVELSRGGKWLKKFQTKKSRVLFVDQERFSGETRRRFKALFAEKALDYRTLEGSLSILCGTSIRLDLDVSYEAFRHRLSVLRPDLVIVDSFVTFHTKEENNRKEIQEVFERLKALRKEFCCSFLFIDHENKGVFHDDQEETPSALRLSGSIAKSSAAEYVLTVRNRGENRSAVFVTKSTLATTPEPFMVAVKDVAEDKSRIEVAVCD